MPASKKVLRILSLLEEHYGAEAVPSLQYETPFELLVATILSAQCTDARVNLVTRDLFQKYRGPEDFAAADLKELEEDIHSTGFYHNKAKNIIAMSRKLLSDYGGEVPRSIEDLTSLPGVGRKTANVIRGHIFQDPSIVVDTHVGRISRRLGLTEAEDPAQVERDLMKKLPKESWIPWNLQLITLGREICKSQRPKCAECFLSGECPSAKN